MTVGGSPAVIDSVNSGLRQAPSEAVYIINRGAVAQLGEHLLCMQGVRGSSPLSSTTATPHLTPLGFLSNSPIEPTLVLLLPNATPSMQESSQMPA